MSKATNFSNVPLTKPDSLLSLAALFEGGFSIDWIEELIEMKPSEILSVLEEGVQQQLLIRTKPGVYLFENSQKRQRYLKYLTENQRESFHRHIGSILMIELPDDDSKALNIAEHLLYVKNDWKGCQWLFRAGEIYVKSLNTEKALRSFGKVLNDLSGVRGENEDWIFIRSAAEYSNFSMAGSNTLSIISILKDAKDRARRLKEESYEILLDMHIAKNEWLHAEFKKALAHFERAKSKAKEMNESELSPQITMANIYFLFLQGRFRDIIDIYGSSTADMEDYRIGYSSLFNALIVARAYTMIGQITQGLGMLDAICDYCSKAGNLYLAAHARAFIAMAMLSIDRLEDTFRHLNCSLKEAQSTGNHWVKLTVMSMLALANYRRGNMKRSLAYLRTFLRNSREMNVAAELHPYLMEIYWAMKMGDLPQIPGLSLEHEIHRMLSVENVFIKGIAFRYQALLGKLKGCSNQKIARSLSLSVQCLRESGHQIELAKSQLELSGHCLSAGNRNKGQKLRQAAADTISQINPAFVPDDLRPFAITQNPEGTILKEILDLESEMAAGKNNGKLLQQIVATANRIMGAERGAILLLEKGSDSQNLQLLASKNLSLQQINYPSFSGSLRMIQEVVGSAKGSVWESNFVENGRSASQEVICSRICVPVVLFEKVIGVLYHDNRILRSTFKESDLKLLGYFAALAALNLGSARDEREVRWSDQKLKKEELLPEEHRFQAYPYEGIIGKSPPIQQVLSEVDKVAGTDTTVLLLGETGVGKDLVAKAIHLHSHRSKGPFIAVQCNSLTESLMTSELFGHEKGSFTGAIDRKIGRFELANGGTLFLDEIGDLPSDVQARLLRVLQTKSFERVGGGKETLTSDFRLIVATNRDLEQDILLNRFRADLYYRINVFPIRIPPLRQRKDDIPSLVQFLLSLYAPKYKKNFQTISQDVIRELMQHDWPGNVRELENVIQRGIILSQGTHFQLPPLEIETKASRPGPFISLKENERRYILEILHKFNWKVHGPKGAAEILEIHPSTLASRMKKLGITRPVRVFSE